MCFILSPKDHGNNWASDTHRNDISWVSLENILPLLTCILFKSLANLPSPETSKLL